MGANLSLLVIGDHEPRWLAGKRARPSVLFGLQAGDLPTSDSLSRIETGQATSRGGSRCRTNV